MCNAFTSMKKASTVDDLYTDELQSMLSVFYLRLSEDNRRLFAAIESKRIGHGGIVIISKFFGCSRPTIYKGIEEIASPHLLAPPDQVRRKGGGRKGVFYEHPNLEVVLGEVLKDTIAGDPMNPDVVWTHLSVKQIQEKLQAKGISITAKTVRIAVKKTLGKTEGSKAQSFGQIRKSR